MKDWEIINCKNCWKQIVVKNNRVLCIKCTNKRNKEVQDAYRKFKV